MLFGHLARMDETADARRILTSVLTWCMLNNDDDDICIQYFKSLLICLVTVMYCILYVCISVH